LLVTGFGYEHDDCWLANMRLFQHFTDVSQGVRRLGSAAIDMCHVASGEAAHALGRGNRPSFS
jgi:myo-inositol-1(or 4)-monophosphatase